MPRPTRLSTSPTRANRMNNGITAVITGSDWTTNSSSEYVDTARLRPRDSTYPAGAATATETTTVARVTPRLLPSQVRVGMSVRTWVKLARPNAARLPEATPGRSDRISTAATGTRTTAVINRIAAKRHHRPRSGLIRAPFGSAGTGPR